MLLCKASFGVPRTVLPEQVFKASLLMQVAPAMNTFMWSSPFTAEHLAKLELLGVKVVPPVSKTLACGDVGTGAMAAPSDIALQIHSLLRV